MNIFETIALLKTKLETGITNSSDLMYGYKVSYDPYEKLEDKIPVVLLEADRTELLLSKYGDPYSQDHYISATAFVRAQTSAISVYKPEINLFVKNMINKLMTIDDVKIGKLMPTEFAHMETFIGSLKVSGITVTLKVNTMWED